MVKMKVDLLKIKFSIEFFFHHILKAFYKKNSTLNLKALEFFSKNMLLEHLLINQDW